MHSINPLVLAIYLKPIIPTGTKIADDSDNSDK